VQLQAGKPQSALANVDAALKRSPRNLSLLTTRGIALDRMSKHADAQETYRLGLSYDPTNFALLSNLGLSLGLSGLPDEGIAILRELVRDGQANSKTRGNLAMLYGLAGRDREAAATLANDLSAPQIQQNLAYYRELRAMLLAGKPIGELQ
jgi:Flp pilus assembly protein TadD